MPTHFLCVHTVFVCVASVFPVFKHLNPTVLVMTVISFKIIVTAHKCRGLRDVTRLNWESTQLCLVNSRQKSYTGFNLLHNHIYTVRYWLDLQNKIDPQSVVLLSHAKAQCERWIHIQLLDLDGIFMRMTESCLSQWKGLWRWEEEGGKNVLTGQRRVT